MNRTARSVAAKSPGWPILLLALVLAAPSPGDAMPPHVLIDTDYGKFAAGDMKKLPPHERITGALPGRWQDNSSWAQVWVSYRRMEQAGRACLRMEVTKVIDGRAQLMHPLGDFKQAALLRLQLTARSRTRSMAEVGIRQQGPPYEFLWSTSLALASEWRQYAFDFRLRPNAQPVGLWINLDGVASIDVAKVRLARLTREALIAELKARYGDGGPRNLLRNTRMPLGLQSGWTIDRDCSDGDDVQIAADREVTGPSGAAALSIRSAGRFRLTTAPFGVPLAFDPHVASLYARGKGKLRLGVLGGGHVRGSIQPELSPQEWRRFSVPFTPDLLRKVYGLRLDGEGEVWIDALQVERGEKPGAYTSQRDCEVALAVDAVTRVQFEDEEPLVRWAVTGKADGGALKAQVVTPYGDCVKLPPVRLGAGFLQQGQLRYDVVAGRPFGPFRVEAWVDDGSDKPISPPNELVVYRLRRPRYWMKDAPDSPFGTHTNSTTRHILMAKAVGVNWTRLHDAGTPYIGWYHLEGEKGKWTFCDKELKRYRRYGMKVLGAFSTAPRWASHFRNEKPHNGYFDRFYQPVDLADFASYVRTVTRRYKDGVIDAWDVWNEPWIHAWWGVDYDETKKGRDGYLTSRDAPADFARLCATAHEAAKAVDPNATVLGVNSTTGGGGSTSFSGDVWTRGVVAAGGLDHCDVICYHQYTGARVGHPGDACELGFQKAVGPIVEKLGKLPRPVWMTEGSPNPQGLGEGFYHHTLPYEPRDDVFDSGDRLSRYLVSLLSQGVRKVFLYSMHCHGYFGDQAWRVLVTPEGYLHPSAAAHATTAWLLEDTRFVKRLAVCEGVTVYLFEGRGRSVAVLSPQPGHAPLTPPRAQGVEALDLFGNPLPKGEPLGARLTYLAAAGKAEMLAKLLGE